MEKQEIHREADERVENRYITLVRAEKWWAKKARENPLFFQEYMTGLTPAKHHRMWMALLFHPDYQRLNFIAPRDSAKTTVLVHAVTWSISKFPLTTNLVVSVSAAQAEKRLRMISSMIKHSERYKNVFPEIAIDPKPPDTQTEFTLMRTDMEYADWRGLVQREGSLKDPTLMVHGRGSKGIIGARVSGWLLLDDIIDEADLSEKAQNDVAEYFVQTLEPTVKDEGKIANIGTRWMLGDFPERLKMNPEWHTVEIPAIKFDEDGNRFSYWPEYWPLERLDRKKKQMNNDKLFNVMYMNDPQGMTEALFTPESLSQDIPKPLPRLRHIYIPTDQALSEKQRADFNVYYIVGIDEDNNYYILDMRRFKADAPTQVQQLINFVDYCASRYNKLDEVLFENVGLQASLPQIIRTMRPDIPIGYHTPKGDKDHRAKNISHLALDGKLFINQDMTGIEILKREWLNYPLLHDDTLDPISLLFQYRMQGISFVRNRTIKSPFLL